MSTDSPPPRSALALLIDLATQLRRDQDALLRELRQRERDVVAEIRPLPEARRPLLEAWLNAIDQNDPPLPGTRIVAASRLATVILAIIALVVGSGAAGAVFYYDGSQPVNVVTVLAVFVALQWLLIIPLLFMLLPAGWMTAMPGANAWREMVSLLSPGRMIAICIRWLPQKHREALEQLFAQGRTHQAVFQRVQTWVFIATAQGMAIAFLLGGIATAVSLVVFTDLAFGWSSTLQIEPESMHWLVSTMAMPWQTIVPDAVPSLELVEQTQYYRADTAVIADPRVATRWWPFVLTSMIIYGLVPRLILFAIARLRLRQAIAQTIEHLPGVDDVIDRLTREQIETRSPRAEIDQATAAQSNPDTATGGVTAGTIARGRPYHLVRWAGFQPEEASLVAALEARFGSRPEAEHTAGLDTDLESDARVISAIGEAKDAMAVVIARAWEPPTLDLLDFVRDLREAIDQQRAIFIVPVSVDAKDRVDPPREEDLDVWGKRMRAHGDAWLSVAVLDDNREDAGDNKAANEATPQTAEDEADE